MKTNCNLQVGHPNQKQICGRSFGILWNNTINKSGITPEKFYCKKFSPIKQSQFGLSEQPSTPAEEQSINEN